MAFGTDIVCRANVPPKPTAAVIGGAAPKRSGGGETIGAKIGVVAEAVRCSRTFVWLRQR